MERCQQKSEYKFFLNPLYSNKTNNQIIIVKFLTNNCRGYIPFQQEIYAWFYGSADTAKTNLNFEKKNLEH